MSNNSTRPVDDGLSEYSLHLEYWTETFGEGHLMVDIREELRSVEDDMDARQRSDLARLDAKAIKLLEDHVGPETWDVKMLRWTVAMARGEDYPKAD